MHITLPQLVTTRLVTACLVARMPKQRTRSLTPKMRIQVPDFLVRQKYDLRLRG